MEIAWQINQWMELWLLFGNTRVTMEAVVTNAIFVDHLMFYLISVRKLNLEKTKEIKFWNCMLNKINLINGETIVTAVYQFMVIDIDTKMFCPYGKLNRKVFSIQRLISTIRK